MISREGIGGRRALADGLLTLAVIALSIYGTVRISQRHWNWQPTFQTRAEFHSIGGLEIGAKVRIQGIDAGAVAAIEPPQKPGGLVTVLFRIDERLKPLVRSDAVASIVTQGVVGAKVVEISPGRFDSPSPAEGGRIGSTEPIEASDFLREARDSLKRLNAVTQAAERGLGELNEIAGGVRQGRGTLGKLVKDDEAYRELLSLSERGRRTLTDLEDNLAALKQTWPISRYFNRRGFDDRDRLLYQPGSQRESRTLSENDLFEHGRAVLTDSGRRKLDEIAGWFKAIRRPKTEVVIAAFTDASLEEDLAQILTQAQADAVRNYLIRYHAIDAKGWFGTRKVAGVGFGSQVPRLATEAEAARDQPARRVEIILFTPQA